MASLLCRQIAVRVFFSTGFEADFFAEEADEYESWAVGLMDFSELKEARLMLLATDGRYREGSHRSVLDLATEDVDFACKRFLQHRHCRTVVAEVYHGFVIPPPPTIEESEFDADKHPVYSDSSVGDQWLDEVHREEARTLISWLNIYRYRASSDVPFVKRHLLLIDYVSSIPMVKFVAHSTSSALFLALFAWQLCGLPWEGKQFMWRSGTYGSFGTTGTTTSIEYVNWAWTLCRVLEEVSNSKPLREHRARSHPVLSHRIRCATAHVDMLQMKQMVRIGREKYELEQKKSAYFEYFRSFENWIELFLYGCILSVAVLRIIVESQSSAQESLDHPARWDQVHEVVRGVDETTMSVLREAAFFALSHPLRLHARTFGCTDS